jgi:hypothetical protein
MVPVLRSDQLFRKSSDSNHEQILVRENRSEEEEEETMLELFGPDDELSAPARSSTKKKQP